MKKSAFLAAICVPAFSPPHRCQRKPSSIAPRAARRTSIPGVNTTGTSFDASEQIYNRIVDFERGGTKVVPSLAEKWDVSAGRHGLHLPPAQERASGTPTRTSSRPATPTRTT